MRDTNAKIIALALAEDIGSGDITAALIDANKMAKATIISRVSAVICGVEWANAVFTQIDSHTVVDWKVVDGAIVKPDQVLCEISGFASALLTAERTALNFLQLLSGVATKTHSYVERIKGTRAQVLDTRKTLPSLRAEEKYAVKCGGGKNHRMGLYDAYLIKENHIQAYGSIAGVIAEARKRHPDKSIEIEVENTVQLTEALDAKADIILLDNFTLDDLRSAVILTDARAKLEASGGVTLENIRAIAETGVDYISVGALTKDVMAIDLSMRFN